MNKFAFHNAKEKEALFAAVKTHAPNLYEAFSRFAGPLQSLPGQQVTSPAVEERLSQLRELLGGFLQETKLSQNPQALQWVEKVIGSMKPALEVSLRGQQSLQERLEQGVPQIDKSIPGAQPQDVGPEHLEDPNAPPSVVPKDHKLSPARKQQPLFTQRPAAKEEWSIEKTAMETASYDGLIDALLEIADIADAAGLLKEADKVAAILPAIRTVKIAQYEGFQNYWIANGRAFEMAYKQKRSKGKTDVDKFRSPHEVWWEILEEYQKSLLSNQADFISKYASKEYSTLDRAAASILMKRINANVENGSSPGVAFYEAIDELASGKHAEIVADSVKATLENIAEAAKQAGNDKLAAKAEALLKKAGWLGDIGRNLIQKIPGMKDFGRPTINLVTNAIGQLKTIVPELVNLQASTAASPTPVSIAEFERIIQPVIPTLEEFFNRAKLTKVIRRDIYPDPAMVEEGDAIEPKRLAQYINYLTQAEVWMKPDIAQKIDEQIYAAKWKGIGPEGAQGWLDHYKTAPAGMGRSGPTSTATPVPTAADLTTQMATLIKDPKAVPEMFKFFKDALDAYGKWKALPDADTYMRTTMGGKNPWGRPYP